MKDEKTALIIIDMQEALFSHQPAHEYQFIQKIQALLKMARAHNTAIIYIQHDGGKGDELEKGVDGWQICEAVKPHADEMVFNKTYNSAFKQTGLQEYLQLRKINRLVIVGMQSEYCIDATIKSAFEKDYQIIVPHGATSTFDNEGFYAEQIIQFYEYQIWDHRYADVCTIERAITFL